MTASDKPMISAMVACRGDGEAARQAFERAGFEAGNAVGGTFSITAPRGQFERVFATKLKEDARDGVTIADSAHPDPHALPLGALPDELKREVAVATFSPPPSFGPSDY